MQNRVTIIGYTGSGKTTYLTGMYMCMSGVGCKNYTIDAIDSNQDLRLEQMWDKLTDGKFPDASNNSEKYSFHISHNYKPVCDFDWLDYPGGVLNQPEHQDCEELNESIQVSDCLLLVLGGDAFNIKAGSEEEYKEKLIKKFKFDKGMRNELKEFNHLSQNNLRIPPICILITKCDLIDFKYRNAIESALRESMSSLFEGAEMLIITSVSLGTNIKEDGPDPFCIEEPIAFSVLMILFKYMEILKQKKTENLNIVNRKRGCFTKWLDSSEIESANEELAKLNEIGNKWMKDAEKLLELFDSEKDIFVNNKKYNFREYIRNRFSEINS